MKKLIWLLIAIVIGIKANFAFEGPVHVLFCETVNPYGSKYDFNPRDCQDLDVLRSKAHDNPQFKKWNFPHYINDFNNPNEVNDFIKQLLYFINKRQSANVAHLLADAADIAHVGNGESFNFKWHIKIDAIHPSFPLTIKPSTGDIVSNIKTLLSHTFALHNKVVTENRLPTSDEEGILISEALSIFKQYLNSK